MPAFRPEPCAFVASRGVDPRGRMSTSRLCRVGRNEKMPPMSFFAAMVLATPIFGLSLQVDPSIASSMPFAVDISVEAAAAAAAAEDDAAPEGLDVASALERRAKIGKIHKWMGISTWIGMTATVTFGAIQYRNLYGFFAGRDDNPCARGDAIPNQDACSGRPWYHTVSSVVTGVLYFTTFGLSYAMPDPIRLDEGDSRSARTLRRHKRLRWAHFGGMAAQALLGFLSSSSHRIGLDRTNDYGAQRAIATTHMLVGAATYITLTWSGAIMIK